MHAKAIAKGEVWTHLTKLFQLVDTSLVGAKTAGLTLSRTKSLFIIIRCRDIMSASQSPIGFAGAEGNTIGSTGPYALFLCPTNKVEVGSQGWPLLLL